MTEKLNSSNLRQNPRTVNELVNELTSFDDDLMSLRNRESWDVS